ncbi:hypothetical protein HanPI659440_Chr14g0548641 [Helianthus annuus]|nr:hypothetical protein HanPI659440_Chr14g0548641 [Helianthus annuus]
MLPVFYQLLPSNTGTVPYQAFSVAVPNFSDNITSTCTNPMVRSYFITWCTKQLIEGCLRKRLWIRAITTRFPEGGMVRASLLSFLANEAAR